MPPGGRTFELNPGDDFSACVVQFSFYLTGAAATLLLGYRATVALWNGIASGALLACMARRTIRDRRFHIAWSGNIPHALCDEGPYAHIRHPLYASYILAFAAMFAALPGWATLAIFLLNLAMFTHAAMTDERSIAQSDLAEAYARYRRRTGMFVPHLFRPV